MTTKCKLAALFIFVSCAVSLSQGICTDKPGYCQGDRCVRGNTGATLEIGQSLWSQNKKYQLAMQGDGNLVIYCRHGSTKPGKYIWHTKTHNIAIADGLRYESNGNLALYRYDRVRAWELNQNNESCYLVLQNDGNLVLYGCYGKVYWHSRTYGKC